MWSLLDRKISCTTLCFTMLVNVQMFCNNSWTFLWRPWDNWVDSWNPRFIIPCNQSDRIVLVSRFQGMIIIAAFIGVSVLFFFSRVVRVTVYFSNYSWCLLYRPLKIYIYFRVPEWAAQADESTILSLWIATPSLLCLLQDLWNGRLLRPTLLVLLTIQSYGIKGT